MKTGPEDHKLLVPEAVLENRVQLSEVRPNPTVSWLGHLAYEVLVEVDQQFLRPRGHGERRLDEIGVSGASGQTLIAGGRSLLTKIQEPAASALCACGPIRNGGCNGGRAARRELKSTLSY
jgi:hypothetical protein